MTVAVEEPSCLLTLESPWTVTHPWQTQDRAQLRNLCKVRVWGSLGFLNLQSCSPLRYYLHPRWNTSVFMSSFSVT